MSRVGSSPGIPLALLVAWLPSCAPGAPPLPGSLPVARTPPTRLVTSEQRSGTEALLQAVSPVSEEVVWVSGHEATVVVTVDGGATWSATVADLGDPTLQLRDVAAFDASTAFVMSSGTGAQSRIYRTDDGGASWRLQYRADHPQAFLDCMDFWDPDHGLAYGDAVDGVPFLLRTEDGGGSWTRVPAAALPPALEGEGGFAASGTCLVTGPGGRAWVATGNADRARVLRTGDSGATWTVTDAPVVAGSASGLATIQVRGEVGVALGGVIGNDTLRSDNVALSRDGGRTWFPGGRPAMPGPVYGSALVPGAEGLVVAVGPRGLDWSADGGATWQGGDGVTRWAVAFASGRAGWAVGPRGRITRLGFETGAR